MGEPDENHRPFLSSSGKSSMKFNAQPLKTLANTVIGVESSHHLGQLPTNTVIYWVCGMTNRELNLIDQFQYSQRKCKNESRFQPITYRSKNFVRHTFDYTTT
jgi:hypothetical protein